MPVSYTHLDVYKRQYYIGAVHEDEPANGEELVKILLDKGDRNIGLIGWEQGDATWLGRWEGYKAGVEKWNKENPDDKAKISEPQLSLIHIFGFIVPFIMGIWLSFCKFTTVTDAKFVGFSNYIEALKDTAFRHSFWYTVLFAIASLLIINIIAFALAMALTKEMHGTNVFRTIFFMPNLIGGIVLGYIWQLIFNGVLSLSLIHISFQVL